MWAVPPTTSPSHLWAAVATTISTSMAGDFQKDWRRERREVLGVSVSAGMDSPGSWETALVSSRYSLSLLFAGESPGSWVTAWDPAVRYSTGVFLQFVRMDSPGSWVFLGKFFSPQQVLYGLFLQFAWMDSPGSWGTSLVPSRYRLLFSLHGWIHLVPG